MCTGFGLDGQLLAWRFWEPMVRSGLGSKGSHEGLLPWSSRPLMGIGVGMLSSLEESHPALLNVLSPQQNTGGCLLQGGGVPGVPPSRCKAVFRGRPVRFHPLSAAECLLLPPHPPHVQVEMCAVPTWLDPWEPRPQNAMTAPADFTLSLTLGPLLTWLWLEHPSWSRQSSQVGHHWRTRAGGGLKAQGRIAWGWRVGGCVSWKEQCWEPGRVVTWRQDPSAAPGHS